MIVPFSVSDFIDRAVQVYGDRVGVVDEPDQPAPSLGRADLRRDRRAGPPPGREARRARHRRRRPGRGRQPQQRPAADVVLRRGRLRPGAGAGELPAPSRRGAATSSSTPAPGCCWSTPSSTRRSQDVDRRAPVRARRRRRPLRAPRAPSPKPWEPDENATATINYTSGTTARPKGVQITHRNIWVNAVTFALHAGVTDRDVYLHTLPMFHANGWGMPFAMTGLGVAAGRAPQGRRRRDPAPGRASTASP